MTDSRPRKWHSVVWLWCWFGVVAAIWFAGEREMATSTQILMRNKPVGSRKIYVLDKSRMNWLQAARQFSCLQTRCTNSVCKWRRVASWETPRRAMNLSSRASSSGCPKTLSKSQKNECSRASLLDLWQVLKRCGACTLALPKESLFVEDQKPAASVIVQLERGATLSNFQVKGIVNLVVAVSSLEVEQVTVVDRSKVLNRKSPDSIDGSTSFDYRRTLERDLEAKATEVLERVVGVGRAVVRTKPMLTLVEKKEQKKSTIQSDRLFGLRKASTRFDRMEAIGLAVQPVPIQMTLTLRRALYALVMRVTQIEKRSLPITKSTRR